MLWHHFRCLTLILSTYGNVNRSEQSQPARPVLTKLQKEPVSQENTGCKPKLVTVDFLGVHKWTRLHAWRPIQLAEIWIIVSFSSQPVPLPLCQFKQSVREILIRVAGGKWRGRKHFPVTCYLSLHRWHAKKSWKNEVTRWLFSLSGILPSQGLGVFWNVPLVSC